MRAVHKASSTEDLNRLKALSAVNNATITHEGAIE